MAKVCTVTGKKRRVGRSITRRGIAKKKKGIGLNTTGIVKRVFHPNLKKKRLWLAEENRYITLRLSTNALRTINSKGLFAVVTKMRREGKRI